MKEMAEIEKLITRPLHRKMRDYAAELGYDDLIFLNIGEPDFSTPPNIINAAINAMNSGITHYTEEKGLPELRRAISLKLQEENTIEVDPNGILVTNGSAEAIFTIIISLINPGDEIILFDPYYPSYLSSTIMVHGKPILSPVNRESLMPELNSVESLVTSKTKAIIVNSPCNPTGMVYNEELMKSLSDTAEDNDIYIISDEVYDSFLYEGEKYASPALFDKSLERTIILNSLSKTYAMTGWRVGYLATNVDLANRIQKLKSTINVCANSISQKAALTALSSSEEYVQKMIDEYAKRRQYMLNALTKIKGFKCPISKGAFYLFPDISEIEMDSLKFSKYLIKEGHVVVSPGIAFGKCGEGHIRISYASSMENLIDAMERLSNAVERYDSIQNI